MLTPADSCRRPAPPRDYEATLRRAGFAVVAGADEAGRGACAGPLVAGAVVLGGPIDGLADSKALSASRRDRLYDEIVARARSWAVVSVEAAECDRLGLGRANIEALRRALLRLDVRPDFALTDGFAVDGLGCPSLGMWKGDQVVACVQAASILAKVTRDRVMVAWDEAYPGYGFSVHKGYVTAEHRQRLAELGPCPIHRRSFGNVQAATRARIEPMGAGTDTVDES